MREILFRAKRLDTGKWAFGHYFANDNGTFIFAWPRHVNFLGEDVMVKVDPETVGQYIGIEDGQGQRIFEGDLITSPRYEQDGVFFRVYFSTNWPGFSTEAPGQRACPGLNRGTMKSYRVAGNIYDNPQLLAEATDGAGQYGLGEVLRSAT